MGTALDCWRQLQKTSPHGCRIHLTGGEPFGDYPMLLDLCRRAQAEGLGPLQKIETNAFWATDEGICRRRIGELAQAGMQKLSLSADPYHQQFVPIRRVRTAAAVAREMLGPQRVQVRWEDWLTEGFDTHALSPAERRGVFIRFGREGRDRLNGRAAERFPDENGGKCLSDLADGNCRESLLRSKHVHVDPDGMVVPGVCAGIILGRLSDGIARVWRDLYCGWADRPIVGRLAEAGPVGLLDEAVGKGFQPAERYDRKCRLCWEVRKFFLQRGEYLDELGPVWMYQAEEAQ